MQHFFQRPRKRFNGLAWTVLIGFRTVAGPFRFGNDADYAIAKLATDRFFQAALVRPGRCSLAAWT